MDFTYYFTLVLLIINVVCSVGFSFKTIFSNKNGMKVAMATALYSQIELFVLLLAFHLVSDTLIVGYTFGGLLILKYFWFINKGIGIITSGFVGAYFIPVLAFISAMFVGD